MEAEVTELAGPGASTTAWIAGPTATAARTAPWVLGGRKLGVRRPRVRGVTDTELHRTPTTPSPPWTCSATTR